MKIYVNECMCVEGVREHDASLNSLNQKSNLIRPSAIMIVPKDFQYKNALCNYMNTWTEESGV
jgi:hypothetical protein